MKRRTLLKAFAVAGVGGPALAELPAATGSDRADPLQNVFRTPPRDALPHCLWFWMNGNVSRDGITRDLEAMHRVGIGGVVNFDTGASIPKGPVDYLGAEWLALKQHAISEADRLGLDFTMHNCPGWSSSGGPWITPELAMQSLTWSETDVEGGRALQLRLDKPFTWTAHYREIAVLALPLPASVQMQDALLRTVTLNGKALPSLGDLAVDAPSADGETIMLLELHAPCTLHGLDFVTRRMGAAGDPGILVEWSGNGIDFQELARWKPGPVEADRTRVMLDFEAVDALFVRLTARAARGYERLRLQQSVRLEGWQAKANHVYGEIDDAAPRPQGTADCASTAVIDLTTRVDAEGNLDWNAPAGCWTILRIGHGSNGRTNRSAPDTGVGLECDKFNPAAFDFHFEHMMERLLPALAPLARTGRAGLEIDSYEVGAQNWTAAFETTFRTRRGYDLLPYLPALTGRIVDDVDTTERVLWDLRRVQADLVAECYYGRFAKRCHDHGLRAWAEPYEHGPFEELQIGQAFDVPTGEFWNGLSSLFQNNLSLRRTVKLVASVAHSGRASLVAAEAFTGEPASSRWQEHPFGMKPIGDRYFTEGLNKIVVHRFAHQPHPTAAPGMTMGPWGTHFDRTNTWWEQSKGWIEYLTRCQALLQHGRFHADVAYFGGESPNHATACARDELNPHLPDGFDYDVLGGDALMGASVRTGKLVLANGMEYRVLVFQGRQALSLALARKLRTLVEAGLQLVAPRPVRSLGLVGATAQAEFARCVEAIWGVSERQADGDRRVGRGLVLPPRAFAEVLAGLVPDVAIETASGEDCIRWIHRVDERAGTDFYFLSNQKREAETATATFRVAAGQAEWWDPQTGFVEPIASTVRGNTTQITLHLAPSASCFVVLRKAAAPIQLLPTAITAAKTTAVPLPPTAMATGDFSLTLWAKPEIDAMLDVFRFRGTQPGWTDFYALWPDDGAALHGQGHGCCGLAIGRNGVVLWERTGPTPELRLAAPAPLAGWSHIALVYRDNAPSIWVDGKLVGEAKASQAIMHPSLSPARIADGASFFYGDLGPREWHDHALIPVEIAELATRARPEPDTGPDWSLRGEGLEVFRAGTYELTFGKRAATLVVPPMPEAIGMTGPWEVRFPPALGAPASISLPELLSLHRHELAGVRHFSGTATYVAHVQVPGNRFAADERLWLDLGAVEVIAQVLVNGIDCGISWARPHRVAVTQAIRPGANLVEIRVTNLWPNRLIGDEALPDPDRFAPGGGGPVQGLDALSAGAILALPEWYVKGETKPDDGRVAFTTWKHYRADSPLLESGLIGPVRLVSSRLHRLG